MTLKEIREYLNLKIYKIKTPVQRILRISSIVVASVVVFSLIYYHGFFITHSEREVITTIIKVGLGFYMFKYVMRLVLSFHPLQDIKATIPEGVLMLLVFLNFLFAKLLGWHMIHSIGELLNLENLELFFAMVIQIYFAIILINEVGRAGNLISNLNLSPPTLLISSFLVLVIVGTGLLMLPQITISGESMPFSDALFTSISASCVTGLVVVDTATYFTVKGQFIIMMLFQFGGLNIISFAALFALFARQSIGLKHQNIIKDSLNVDSLNASSSLFRKIFTFSITIELIGAALIFLSWGDGVEFKSLTDKAFNSLFHSISAFNNAGFSLFSNGLFEEGLRDSYMLHFIVATIIILGGIGFAVIRDVLDVKHRKKGRKRRHALKLNSKIALIGSAILIVAGFFILYVFEHNNTMADKSTFGKITASFFQSVTSRTAGFNTLDIGALAAPSLIFLIFLMFIGASPGSTGGGVKTNTFVIVFLGAISTARGKGRLELFRNTIPFDLLNKAFLIFLFSIAFISLGIFGLAITEPDKDLLALSFEEVSAYCTVGLSTGITSDISPAGRIIIMLSMFLGRIGTLSLAFALGKKKKKVDYKYPKTNIMVG